MDMHNIRFPKMDSSHLDQDKAFFYLINEDKKQKILLHDCISLHNIHVESHSKFYSGVGWYSNWLLENGTKCMK
jgi:hypothetical protein